MKLRGVPSFFNHVRLHKMQAAPTLNRPHVLKHWSDCRLMSFREWKRLGSFPDDYHAKTDRIGKYMIGMSVPPRMTEVVARAVCVKWLGVIENKIAA